MSVEYRVVFLVSSILVFLVSDTSLVSCVLLSLVHTISFRALHVTFLESVLMLIQKCSTCQNSYTLRSEVNHVFEWGQCPNCWSKTLEDEKSDEQQIGIQSLKTIDDVDTRREIRHCLSKLSEFERIAFLYWCGRASHQMILATSEPPWHLFEIRNLTGSLDETIADFYAMIANFGLPISLCLRQLEKMAAGKLVIF